MSAPRPAQRSGPRGATFRIATASLAGVIGLLCLYFGYETHSQSHNLRAFEAELTALPGPDKQNEGDRVIVDGHIASDAPLLKSEFVVFQRTEYRCPTPGVPRCASRDVETEAGKQSFDVITSDGPVKVMNDNYRFDVRPMRWAAVERVEAPPGITTGARKIKGFVRASPVVVIGTLVTTAQHQTVQAETVTAGPRAALQKQIGDSVGRLASSVFYFVLVGAVLLVYAGWQFWRLSRG